ncbi:MAG: hypothetical protein AB7T49_17665 [Oligoflexales bacterium]
MTINFSNFAKQSTKLLSILFCIHASAAHAIYCSADCQITRRDSVDEWTSNDDWQQRAVNCRDNGNYVRNQPGNPVRHYCVRTTKFSVPVSGNHANYNDAAEEVYRECRGNNISGGEYSFPQQFTQLGNMQCD